MHDIDKEKFEKKKDIVKGKRTKKERKFWNISPITRVHSDHKSGAKGYSRKNKDSFDTE